MKKSYKKADWYKDRCDEILSYEGKSQRPWALIG